MAFRGTTIAAAVGLLVCAFPAAALANQTGNQNNDPAVIQGQAPDETGSIMSPMMSQPMAEPMMQPQMMQPQRRHCSFLGEEAGNRNPDYVQCFDN